MKNAKKRLLISAMVLISTIVLATSTTLAWFTMDNTPTVDGFEVNVTTQDGLYVSLVPSTSDVETGNYLAYIGDGTDATTGLAGSFKSYLTAAEIKQAMLLYNEGAFASGGALKALTHATTTDGIDFSIPEDKFVVGMREGVAETTHITFRLYFYSNTKYTVSLKTDEVEDFAGETTTSSVTSTPVEEDKAIPYTKAWIGHGLAGLNVSDNVVAHAKDAVRISFDSGEVDGEGKKVIKLWNPNSGEGWDAASKYTALSTSKNAALDYYNFVNPEEDKELSLTGITTMAATDLELLTLNGDDEDGYNGYLDITIWIEGWDADAFNSILSDIIATTLVFEGEFA